MLPVKLFNKFTGANGIDHENYSQEVDLVGRFRLFDKISEAQAGDSPSKTEEDILDYLSVYSKDPLSKPELVNHMMKKLCEKGNIAEKFQIKRSGKDLNEIYWQFGKIHGLENIGQLSDEEFAKLDGNPVTLQQAVNRIKPEDIKGYASAEEANEAREEALNKYRAEIDKLSLQPSDRKKLLALPFFMAKRAESPDVRVGMAEKEIYETIFGRDWFFKPHEMVDDEKKITEFDYENYLQPELVSGEDTDTEEFKRLVRLLNLTSKTQLEQSDADKEGFRDAMPALAMLTQEEKWSLVHLLRNESTKRLASGSESESAANIFECDNKAATELAKISEKANYELKNQYIH